MRRYDFHLLRANSRSLPVIALFVFFTHTPRAQDDPLKQCQAAAAAKLETAVQICSDAIMHASLAPAALADAYLSRGTAYDTKKDYEKAIADFHEVVRLQPKSAVAYYALAQVAMEQSNSTEAIQRYSDALRANPKFVPALTDRGLAYLSKGDSDHALEDFTQAIRIGPEYIPAYMNRASVYARRNDLSLALRDYDRILQINPSYLPGILARANTRAAAKQYDDAIYDLDDAIRLQTGNAGIWARQSDIYAEKGDYAHAIRDLNAALRLQPSNATLLSARGYSETYIGDYTSAERDLTAALASKKDEAYFTLWIFLAQRKAGKPGIDDLKKNAASVKMDAWPASVLRFYLGELPSDAVLEAANNGDALKSVGQHCEAYFYLGEDALLRGKPDEAAKLFQQSISTGLSAYVEYRGAMAELDRMKAFHN
ncbi:MAG TPA: tetratricopeptide repeat protein [Candidatus Acidoferrales bacterium]|nr:tetratricopeptide repeat protein [Candidatus Acidoferrales bacterium]